MRRLRDLGLALASGKTTSRALVELCLGRIADATGEGARTFTRVYDAEARASADAQDGLRRAGRAPGPYAGIPVSIKDLFDVAGETTRAGSVVLADAPPAARNAPVVDRLLQAGLIPIGRTNMTEFAFSGVGINPHYGTPLSPWDRATGRIPGGSSSGAAVSVADGFAFAAVGTDTGGSCRIPAALCGCAGFKPTARRVPLEGVLPLSPSLDSVGPLANTAECCAIVDGILAGESDPSLPGVGLVGLRLLLPTNLALDHLDIATELALDRAVAALDKAGACIDRRPVAAFDMMDAAHSNGGFAAVECFAWHQGMLSEARKEYDPRVADRIASGADMTGAQYFRLGQARTRIIKSFEAEMAAYDALIMPTVPMVPPALTAFDSDDTYRKLNFLLLRNPAAINFMDGCAVSIPCNAPGAPPAGLMIAGPAMRDRRVLAIAVAAEALLPDTGPG